MNKQLYDKVISQLTKHRKGVSDEKREDYTRGNEDVLKNFKSVAESTGVSPLQVWLVYSQKHFDAIANYVKSGGKSESEPIKERFGDLLNYLELGWALVDEKKHTKGVVINKTFEKEKEDILNHFDIKGDLKQLEKEFYIDCLKDEINTEFLIKMVGIIDRPHLKNIQEHVKKSLKERQKQLNKLKTYING